IETALRDASNRLDRAKRFLPETIDPPIIYKLDPSQIPVLELVVSSGKRNITELYEWADYLFSKSLINLPGVASVEVGGGQAKEISIEIDQERLAAVGLTIKDISELIDAENRDSPGGRLVMGKRELNTRLAGRFTGLSDLQYFPLRSDGGAAETPLLLGEVADIRAGHGAEELRIRVDGVPGIKLSVQKQPQANTVAVVEGVLRQIEWMKAQGLIPHDVLVKRINDQAVLIRHALRNAAYAAGSGAVLAMMVVYLFLGNLRRTLIVCSAIPLAILVTFMLMQLGSLTLNIMTLGGLALGIGILVDNTIVMLENVYRHQHQGDNELDDAVIAAAEVYSPIVASTTTNLAAVMPFLFIGGLVGLLFRELILTISAAIAASMVVALTLVPALAARVHTPAPGRFRLLIDRWLRGLQEAYARFTHCILRRPWLPLLFLVPALAWAGHFFFHGEQTFLPPVDEGQVRIKIKGDTGMRLDEMDKVVRRLESLLARQDEVQTVFTQAGGFVYGRTQWYSGNRSTLSVQLVKPQQRTLTTEQWVQRMQQELVRLELPGFDINIWTKDRVRGIRLGRGDESISLRISGPDIDQLTRLGNEVVHRLRDIDGLHNLKHTYQDFSEEIEVVIDRVRAADLDVSLEDVGRALRIAVEGLVVTDFIEDDRRYDVRLQLSPQTITTAEDIGGVIVTRQEDQSIRLRDFAKVRLQSSPASIMRDRQVRTVQISASLRDGYILEPMMDEIDNRLDGLKLPAGYSLYDDGAATALKEGQQLSGLLLLLAILLVFVVMAVQYESLRNPTVILFSIPFAVIGVAAGLWYNSLPLSMPVWLGMIMLTGIVVNNAIVLVEQIEIEREKGLEMIKAIVHAARLRLRPILMTALTTVVGMTPLALGLGQGSEMLQPLAVVMVWGLSFSTLVTLLIVPSIYRMLQSRRS
ncbi:MAG: efflux RND transporter permease subunit, partial [Gammaproteobacteria bacterium]|nr:efflux RND transporter permease subunit [Gammaproteobacteria bacterium]